MKNGARRSGLGQLPGFHVVSPALESDCLHPCLPTHSAPSMPPVAGDSEGAVCTSVRKDIAKSSAKNLGKQDC